MLDGEVEEEPDMVLFGFVLFAFLCCQTFHPIQSLGIHNQFHQVNITNTVASKPHEESNKLGGFFKKLQPHIAALISGDNTAKETKPTHPLPAPTPTTAITSAPASTDPSPNSEVITNILYSCGDIG